MTKLHKIAINTKLSESVRASSVRDMADIQGVKHSSLQDYEVIQLYMFTSWI